MNERNQKQELPVNFFVDFQDSLRMAEEKYRNTNNPSKKIKGLLRELALFYEADGTCVLETDWELGIAVNTYVYHIDGIVPKTQRIIHIPMSRYSGYIDKLKAKQPVIITETKFDEMRGENDAEVLWDGIRHILATPFMNRYNTGIVIVVNPKKYKNNISFLQIMSTMVIADINEIKLQERVAIVMKNINTKPEALYCKG